MSKDRAAIIREKGVFGAPDLVIEVLSPATAQRDRTVRAKLCARVGVGELWLVDPDARTIEILSNGPSGFQRISLSGAGETAASALLPGLEVAVSKVLTRKQRPGPPGRDSASSWCFSKGVGGQPKAPGWG